MKRLIFLFTLYAFAAGAQISELSAPVYADVKYDSYSRCQMDFFAAEGSGLRPAVVVMNPGGFTGGSKEQMRSNPILRKLFHSGVSLAIVNYRYITTDPFPAPFLDGARAVQFLRSKAAEWNVDPERIGGFGGSAGANILIWLAVQDEMADPQNTDPVLRESSRLRCVVGNAAQTFNDPELVLKTIGGNPAIHQSWMLAMKSGQVADFKDPKALELARQLSAINYVTPDDPPLYLVYDEKEGGTPLPPDTPVQRSIHHPLFGLMMQEKYKAAGLECIVVTPDTVNRSALISPDKWMLKHLTE